MRELWNMLQAVFTGIGGWLGYFLGGCDGLLYALIAFTVIDYISGVMCGIGIRVHACWGGHHSGHENISDR